jgi:hypothetical protein
MVKEFAAEREETRQAKRQRRDEEFERDRLMSDHWERVRGDFEAFMRHSGFHNVNSRGWKKRRKRSEGGRDA